MITSARAVRRALPPSTRPGHASARPLLGVLLAALGQGACRPAEPPAAPAPLYTVAGVKRLRDGRINPGGSVLVEELDNGSRQVIGLDAHGGRLWTSPPLAQALLGPTLDAPIYTVAMGEGPRQVSVLTASTGKVERSFTLARPAQRYDRWERAGDDLLVIEAPTDEATSAVTLVDGTTGAVRWTRDLGVSVPMDLGWVFHSPVIFKGSSIHLLCKDPGSKDFYPDLCRLSRADGSLTPVAYDPIIDMAAPASTLFVLRSDSIEALAEDGTTRWKHPLPPGYYGKGLAAGPGWLVAFSRLSHDRNRSEDQLLALDAVDGHVLWTKDSGSGGESYSGDLAMSDDRVFFVSNIDPNLRVLDRQGALVLGDRWKTSFVVSTEAVFGSVEGLEGRPLFQGPLLVLPRRERGVEVYRVP